MTLYIKNITYASDTLLRFSLKLIKKSENTFDTLKFKGYRHKEWILEPRSWTSLHFTITLKHLRKV